MSAETLKLFIQMLNEDYYIRHFKDQEGGKNEQSTIFRTTT